jgi:hypothetical protein
MAMMIVVLEMMVMVMMVVVVRLAYVCRGSNGDGSSDE